MSDRRVLRARCRRHHRRAAFNAAVLGLSSSLDSLYTGDVTLAFTSAFFSTQVLRCSFLTSFIMLLCVVFVCSCAAPPQSWVKFKIPAKNEIQKIRENDGSYLFLQRFDKFLI